MSHVAPRVLFGSKAETLDRVGPYLTTAKVLPQLRFQLGDWREDPAHILAELKAKPWGARPVIVRSSASAEDRAGQSMAGHFLSVANVEPAEVAQAIEKVAASFGQDPAPAEQIFVQPMLTEVTQSGVAFSRDPNTGSPYLVINYDNAGDTAAVTSGGRAELSTYVYWRGREKPCPAPLDRVADLADELERLLGNDALDIEFAFTRAGELVLLQVRPLVLADIARADLASHRALLTAIGEKIRQANRPHPYLRGRHTLYGVMPDWNPAEIIGTRPRQLALSLYRNLVTDSIWAYQRHNYGYRNLRSFPLMQSFHGLPYIDVRLSFNSFIPSDIPDGLADRLVDCYIEQLRAAPVLHDKVEFEIVYSCYAFDLDQRLRRLEEYGFSEEERGVLSQSLLRLTNRIVHSDKGLWRADAERIRMLEERQRIIGSSDMDLISRIYWLIEDCKRYGTLPFAGLARAGFIAVQILRSLVAVDALTPEQYDAFMASLDTVSGRMARDLKRLSKPAFLAEYGHLRPGTYDILSPRYDEAPELYLTFDQDAAEEPEAANSHPPFALSLPQMRRITDLLQQHGLEMDVVSLFEFLQAGIQGREHAKFIFTRSLSNVLSLLVELGNSHGFDREDISFLDIARIEDMYASSGDIKRILAESIAQGRARYVETQQICLPPLLGTPEDVWGFFVPPTSPNFITQLQAQGLVRSYKEPSSQLKDSIVMIPSADPGFDWIFSHGIKGFITAYGGVNSHMAIRAGELKIPAVVGAGESLFQRWSGARRLHLDCAGRRVEILE